MLRVLSSGEDWEIVDDDGFIFKRAKKVQIATVTDTNDEVCTGQQSFLQYRNSECPSFEQARNKRKEMLLMVRNIYSAELQQWKDLHSAKLQEAGSVQSDNSELPSSRALDCHLNPFGDPYEEARMELSGQVAELDQLIREWTDICDRAESVIQLLDQDIQKKEEQLFQLMCHSPHQLFADLTIPD